VCGGDSKNSLPISSSWDFAMNFQTQDSSTQKLAVKAFMHPK
jgi:hypothetical protein